MSRWIFGLLLIVSAVAQATVLPLLGSRAGLPNVVLVLILVRSARRGVVASLVWIILSGLILDTLALDPLGTNGLALLPVAIVGGLGQRRWFISGPAFPMLLALVATYAYAVTLLIIRAYAGEGLAPLPAILQMTVFQSLLNAVLVLPVYGLVGWLGRNDVERFS